MQEKAKKFLYCDSHGFGYLLDYAMDILGYALTLAGLASIIALMNGQIVLLFAALSLLGAYIEGKARMKAMRLSLDVIGDQRRWVYYGKLFEDYHFGKEIRLNNLTEWLIGREAQFMKRANENIGRQNTLFIRSGVAGAVFTFIEQGAAYAYLIAQILRKTVGIGDFILFVAAVTAFGAALRNLMDSVVSIRSYDMYYDRLDEYLNLPRTLRTGKLRPGKGPYTIRFEDVGFRYPNAEGWTLRHVNLVLESGEKLCLVGENGAGKSTFVKLLCRMYEPAEGRILLDGTDIRELDYDAYIKLFSCVFQDFRLFSMSMKDNAAFDTGASEKEILHALEQAGMGA